MQSENKEGQNYDCFWPYLDYSILVSESVIGGWAELVILRGRYTGQLVGNDEYH